MSSFYLNKIQTNTNQFLISLYLFVITKYEISFFRILNGKNWSPHKN